VKKRRLNERVGRRAEVYTGARAKKPETSTIVLSEIEKEFVGYLNTLCQKQTKKRKEETKS